MDFELAQFNVARMAGPLDSPVMAGFVARLDELNRLADEARGFVWRLRDEGGSATAYRPYDDDRLIVNLSVWSDVDSLYRYTYYSDHAGAFRERRAWFEPLDGPHLVLWWVPAGHRPDLPECVARLERLRRDGPTPEAFTFKARVPPPDPSGGSASRPVPG